MLTEADSMKYVSNLIFFKIIILLIELIFQTADLPSMTIVGIMHIKPIGGIELFIFSMRKGKDARYL